MKRSEQIKLLCGCNFGGLEGLAEINDGYCLDMREYCTSCRTTGRLEQ
jgi:hypothetical protein